ncbi:hypothetical protein [Jeotgalibacillus soli]|uniref:hypothetical protein n=1 Tax=Jeotgalibacillus soli TaxID=889306 RepID=UPI0010395F03|nr:hypothetical protein [Jeotgalibacillus soli]
MNSVISCCYAACRSLLVKNSIEERHQGRTVEVVDRNGRVHRSVIVAADPPRGMFLSETILEGEDRRRIF